VDPFRRQHVTPDRLHDRGERHRAGADTVGQRRSVDRNSLAGEGVALPVQRFSGWWSMNFDTSTLASRFGPAKPRGIGWDGAGVSVTPSQSRHVIFSSTCSMIFHRRGSHSSERDTTSSSLRRRAPPHLAQAQGAGYTIRSTGRQAVEQGAGEPLGPEVQSSKGRFEVMMVEPRS